MDVRNLMLQKKTATKKLSTENIFFKFCFVVWLQWSPAFSRTDHKTVKQC